MGLVEDDSQTHASLTDDDPKQKVQTAQVDRKLVQSKQQVWLLRHLIVFNGWYQ